VSKSNGNSFIRIESSVNKFVYPMLVDFSEEAKKVNEVVVRKLFKRSSLSEWEWKEIRDLFDNVYGIETKSKMEENRCNFFNFIEKTNSKKLNELFVVNISFEEEIFLKNIVVKSYISYVDKLIVDPFVKMSSDLLAFKFNEKWEINQKLEMICIFDAVKKGLLINKEMINGYNLYDNLENLKKSIVVNWDKRKKDHEEFNILKHKIELYERKWKEEEKGLLKQCKRNENLELELNLLRKDLNESSERETSFKKLIDSKWYLRNWTITFSIGILALIIFVVKLVNILITRIIRFFAKMVRFIFTFKKKETKK
jgi:hypothetical protein